MPLNKSESTNGRLSPLSSAAVSVLVCAAAMSATCLAQDGQATATARPILLEDGTIRVPAFELSLSTFLTPEGRAGALRLRRSWESNPEGCSHGLNTTEGILAFRRCLDEIVSPLATKQKARYDVQIRSETIAGVRTEAIVPANGVSGPNRNRVLINLHGGGFIGGAPSAGQVESIPIAALGRIKVVSVDYRMAPEHRFPAASADVAAVYRQLIKRYRPENIGIYGCSAGGLLTAQAVSWFLKEGLPLPGAVGMFCAAAASFYEGDSFTISSAIKGGGGGGGGKEGLQGHPYLKNADPTDPLAFPVNAPEVLARFPPSLLISATRDFALSSVLHTHARLVKAGAIADLHVWDGLDHRFFYDPDLPESRDMYDVTVKFFAKYLGKR